MRQEQRGQQMIAFAMAAFVLAVFALGGFLVVRTMRNTDSSDQKKNAPAATSEKMAKSGKILSIDGGTLDENPRNAFRGLGAVTCNGSSRLIMDYKEENPEAYWEIMHWLFDTKTGAGLSHIKIELGCDTDTSSGAEPATKRSEEEEANVNRGAGFMFAHDALTINPEITVDMLCWGMPAWVEQAYEKSKKEGYQARFRWYKETIDAAYDTWGIQFSYLSANQNERDLEQNWVIYLAENLKKHTERYDYGKIKIVSADETDNMYVADLLLKNKKFRDAVDVLGFHYNSYMNKKVMKLNKEYDKEIWFSEGASIATDSVFGSNNTDNGVNTSGTNGMLDVANRIIIAMAQSNMTMYEFQPALASYYDGAVYYPKQLMSANHPWNGYYECTNGLVMAMHFTNFIQKGWKRVNSASYGDGVQEDHCISKTKDDYYTAADPKTGDYSTVITNDSGKPRVYTVQVSGLKKAAEKVSVWETRSNQAEEDYDDGWLNKITELTPVQDGSAYCYQITVNPYSMVTLTTTTGQKSYQKRKKETAMADDSKNMPLELPYTDDFEYDEEYIQERGGTPRYTSDLNGAFEVVALEDGTHCLQQQIGKKDVPTGWGSVSDPITSLGDDRWKDYIVSVDVMLDPEEDGDNYVSLCARYNSCYNISQNGYWLKLKQDGEWTLQSVQGRLAKGRTSDIEKGQWYQLKLEVQGRKVKAYIDDKQVASKTMKGMFTNSGRVALGGKFAKNCYGNLSIEPIEGAVDYVTRVDNMDSAIQYSENVKLQQSLPYANYGRTLSIMGKTGDSMSYTFQGTGIALLGLNSTKAKIKISMDGEVVEDSYKIPETDSRSAFYHCADLPDGEHTITIELLNSKELNLDALEVEAAKSQS